jgi:hydrogenase expression/formation protein
MVEVSATAEISSDISRDILTYEKAGVTMGAFGVGSRGTGDFYAHRKIAEIIGTSAATVGVEDMDDAGVVQAGGQYIVCTVDGMHSRLSDFPYLAGFHVTRATLRDCYVMGARPVMLFSDIHVADDGDVAKIFDYTAGVTTVGELTGVPLVSGSTLRIGEYGDWRPDDRVRRNRGGCRSHHRTSAGISGGSAAHDRRGRRRNHCNNCPLLRVS